jgi:hypothetical protein
MDLCNTVLQVITCYLPLQSPPGFDHVLNSRWRIEIIFYLATYFFLFSWLLPRFVQRTPFLAISSQSTSTASSRTRLISWQQLTQMNSSSTELSYFWFSFDSSSHFTAHSTTDRFFITTLHGPLRKHGRCWEGDVFTDLLPSSGRLLHAFASGRMCVPSLCLAMGIHVTIRKHMWTKCRVFLCVKHMMRVVTIVP